MAEARRALISGITGQDGSYLADLLVAAGYEVHGVVRPETLGAGGAGLAAIAHHGNTVVLHEGDVGDAASLRAAVAAARPDEIYHVAGPHHQATEEHDVARLEAIVTGTEALLGAIAVTVPHCRFLLAGSSQMYGAPKSTPQDETTPFAPDNVYARHKVTACESIRQRRSRGSLWGCTAVLFNHESPRRPVRFVTRKVSRAAAAISLGRQSELRLGNLDARRDWGYAPDFADAMRRMLSADEPDDYVVASGETHTLRDLVAAAFAAVELDWQEYVVVDPAYYRQEEGAEVRGDHSKITARLGWRPTKPFADIVAEMVAADLAGLGATRSER